MSTLSLLRRQPDERLQPQAAGHSSEASYFAVSFDASTTFLRCKHRSRGVVESVEVLISFENSVQLIVPYLSLLSGDVSCNDRQPAG